MLEIELFAAGKQMPQAIAGGELIGTARAASVVAADRAVSTDACTARKAKNQRVGRKVQGVEPKDFCNARQLEQRCNAISGGHNGRF